jgi:hypothetical protein
MKFLIESILALITVALIVVIIGLIALNLSGCIKSHNLIIQHCNEKQTEGAIRFYEHCLGNWGKLSEYGCQVRAVEHYCEAKPKIRGHL